MQTSIYIYVGMLIRSSSCHIDKMTIYKAHDTIIIVTIVRYKFISLNLLEKFLAIHINKMHRLLPVNIHISTTFVYYFNKYLFNVFKSKRLHVIGFTR